MLRGYRMLRGRRVSRRRRVWEGSAMHRRALMAERIVLYPLYSYLVALEGVFGAEVFFLGGFSELSALAPHMRKIEGVHKVGDVTLRRGVVDSAGLWSWMEEGRNSGAKSLRSVIVTQRDEDNDPVRVYKLAGVTPMQYKGPELGGSGEVAIEELVLSVESLEVIPHL
jgi:phage tail-like protein